MCIGFGESEKYMDILDTLLPSYWPKAATVLNDLAARATPLSLQPRRHHLAFSLLPYTVKSIHLSQTMHFFSSITLITCAR